MLSALQDYSGCRVSAATIVGSWLSCCRRRIVLRARRSASLHASARARHPHRRAPATPPRPNPPNLPGDRESAWSDAAKTGYGSRPVRPLASGQPTRSHSSGTRTRVSQPVPRVCRSAICENKRGVGGRRRAGRVGLRCARKVLRGSRRRFPAQWVRFRRRRGRVRGLCGRDRNRLFDTASHAAPATIRCRSVSSALNQKGSQ